MPHSEPRWEISSQLFRGRSGNPLSKGPKQDNKFALEKKEQSGLHFSRVVVNTSKGKERR